MPFNSIDGQQIIGLRSSADGQSSFSAPRASTGSMLEPPFYEATDEEIDAASELALAAAAYWSESDPTTRSHFLRELAEEMVRHQPQIVERAELETGLARPRLDGEFARACGQLRLFADVIDEGSWVDARLDRGDPLRPGIPKPEMRRMLVAVGPVGVFGACNFPFAISVVGNDTVAAWAAGCPVVVKAHPGHPGTCELQGKCVQRVVQRLGLPEGLFSLVQGHSHRIGQRLVQHPAIRAIGFTGSLTGGRALWQLAQQRPDPIPFFAELGSLNPVFVLPSALEDPSPSLAQAIVQSIAFSQGQMCTRPGFVFYVADNNEERWKLQLTQAADSAPTAALLTPAVACAFAASVSEYRQQNQARLLSPAKLDESQLAQQPPIVLLEIDAERITHPVSLWQEAFGPVSVLIRCRSVTEMLTLAKSLPSGLTATLRTGTPIEDEVQSWAGELRHKFGRLIWNGMPTGVEVGHATQHGGPYPASFDGQGTSIGTASITRFARPVCFQDFPESLLPAELQADNPRNLWRRIDGQLTRDKLEKA